MDSYQNTLSLAYPTVASLCTYKGGLRLWGPATVFSCFMLLMVLIHQGFSGLRAFVCAFLSAVLGSLPLCMLESFSLLNLSTQSKSPYSVTVPICFGLLGYTRLPFTSLPSFLENKLYGKGVLFTAIVLSSTEY